MIVELNVNIKISERMIMIMLSLSHVPASPDNNTLNILHYVVILETVTAAS